MAPWIFTERISNNQTIRVFNHGKSRRDFTYVGDIVQGIIHSLFVNTGRPEIINLGNGRPVILKDFVQIVEERVGQKAQIVSVGMQKGDVLATYADITKARYLLAYNPTTPIEEGISTFVKWFHEHDASRHQVSSWCSLINTLVYYNCLWSAFIDLVCGPNISRLCSRAPRLQSLPWFWHFAASIPPKWDWHVHPMVAVG